jgi:hypothetical protein
MRDQSSARKVSKPGKPSVWNTVTATLTRKQTMAATPQDSLACSAHGGIPTHVHVSSHPIPVPPIEKKDESVPCGPGHQRQDSRSFFAASPSLAEAQTRGPMQHYLIIVTH